MSLLCGISANATLLIAARSVQGIGGAALLAVGPALLSEVFEGRQRSFALGIYGSVAGFAMAFGPMFGGALISSFGWRSIFLVNVPACVAIAWLLRRFAGSPATRPSAPIDWGGGALIIVGMSSFVGLAMQVGNPAGAGGTTWLLVGTTATAAVAFVFIERRRGRHALFDVAEFRDLTTNGMLILALVTGTTSISIIFFSTVYLQNKIGLSPGLTGVAMLPLTLLVWVGNISSASLAKRVSIRALLVLSTSLVAVGAALGATSGPFELWTTLVLMMVISGFGLGLWNPIRLMVVIDRAQPGRAGMSSGYNQSIEYLGVVLGISLTGMFFQARVSSVLFDMRERLPPGTALHELAAQVVIGRIVRPADSMASSNRGIAEVAAAAYQSAFQHTMLLIAAIACAAAVVAAVTIRTRRLSDEHKAVQD